MVEGMDTGEAFYLGEYEYAVDNQRRVAIPSRWRAKPADRNHFFALPGREKSIQLVPAPVFEQLLLKLRKVSFADGKAARAMAKIGSMASECRCDKQGRIRLTGKLLNHAGITDKALLLGAVSSIQIWSPEAWARGDLDSESTLDVVQEIQERSDDLSEIFNKRT